jgi:hypothetical protein
MKKLVLPIFFLSCYIASSQTLQEKWDNMVKKSYTYNAHKVVKQEDLNLMWKAIKDTMWMADVKVKHEQKIVKAQLAEITLLKNKEREAQRNLLKAEEERNKAVESYNRVDTYILTLWLVIGMVLLACGFIFLLFRRSNSITLAKTHDYQELTKSFDTYRAEKLELERKLKREIQTYMNQAQEPRARS